MTHGYLTIVCVHVASGKAPLVARYPVSDEPVPPVPFDYIPVIGPDNCDDLVGVCGFCDQADDAAFGNIDNYKLICTACLQVKQSGVG